MLETNEYLCNMYRQLSQESSHSDMFQISKDIGTGEIRRMKSKQGLIFSNWNMIFHSDMNVYGKNYDQYIDFSLHLFEKNMASIQKNFRKVIWIIWSKNKHFFGSFL